MRRAFGCAALSCALGLIDAKALKWSDDGPAWFPAQETQFGFMNEVGLNPPMPTAAPKGSKQRGVLRARDSTDNTCGYVNGNPTISLWCSSTAHCVYNSINSHIGCCDDTGNSPCQISTVCYDRTDSESYTTNNGLTLWCGDTRWPYCTTYLYQDDNWRGYTVLGCAVAAGTGRIWYTSPSDTETSTSTTPETSTTSISLITTPSEPSSTTPSAPTSPSGRSSTPTPTPGPSTPVGPIVGGVVGGVAALALIGVVVWLLLRQRAKQKNGNAAGAAAAGAMYQPQQFPPPGGGPAQSNPHMSQIPPQGYYGQGGYDPRASIANTPGGTAVSHSPSGYDQSTVSGISPPGSPPPPSVFAAFKANHSTPSPPPGQQSQYGQQGYENVSPGTVSPVTQIGGFQQQNQQHQQAQHGADQLGSVPVELPVARGDGELRELQG
ncbi:hypothetical protein VTI28DRAFT_2436 [Corynascus sepedonium]